VVKALDYSSVPRIADPRNGFEGGPEVLMQKDKSADPYTYLHCTLSSELWSHGSGVAARFRAWGKSSSYICIWWV
jgi:hypothetical protein